MSRVRGFDNQLERGSNGLTLLTKGVRRYPGTYEEVSLTTLPDIKPQLTSYTFNALLPIDPEFNILRMKIQSHRPANSYETRRFKEQIKANISRLDQNELRAARIALGVF